MAPAFDLLEFLTYFAQSTPMLLTALAGLIVSLVFWKRHPKVSLLAFLGFAVYLVNIAGGNLIAYLLPRVILPNGTAQQLSHAYAILGLGRAILSSGAMILFIFAMFGWRGVARPVRSATPLGPEPESRTPPASAADSIRSLS
jgi:hypothetical protein